VVVRILQLWYNVCGWNLPSNTKKSNRASATYKPPTPPPLFPLHPPSTMNQSNSYVSTLPFSRRSTNSNTLKTHTRRNRVHIYISFQRPPKQSTQDTSMTRETALLESLPMRRPHSSACNAGMQTTEATPNLCHYLDPFYLWSPNVRYRTQDGRLVRSATEHWAWYQ
jgi:hypothetical protein